VAHLRRSHPDVFGIVVGGSHETELQYERDLHGRAAALGLAEAVKFSGFQSNALEWMRCMDVVVHASDREPFGIVVIEALALGLPVVASASGGPAEMITPGVDGLLAPFGDSAAISEACARFLDDPEFARKTGVAARVRASAFSAPAYAANVVAAVRGIAAGVPT
jgi:glycosyltransferase involved in cell wall biosynthesis